MGCNASTAVSPDMIIINQTQTTPSANGGEDVILSRSQIAIPINDQNSDLILYAIDRVSVKPYLASSRTPPESIRTITSIIKRRGHLPGQVTFEESC